jgi:hypothetical protein
MGIQSHLDTSDVIDWACPIPAFGNLAESKVATLGINPSNKEFVDAFGDELSGSARRFHTLNSFNLDSWAKAEESHIATIQESCDQYFRRNPYDRWFKRLDEVLESAGYSFYEPMFNASHLDLVPLATSDKWMNLPTKSRTELLSYYGDVLALLIRQSKFQLIILNGKTVVDGFQKLAGMTLSVIPDERLDLQRKTGRPVRGYFYRGIINNMRGIRLDRRILILGYNHNLQSSFGVTTKVRLLISQWIRNETMQLGAV